MAGGRTDSSEHTALNSSSPPSSFQLPKLMQNQGQNEAHPQLPKDATSSAPGQEAGERWGSQGMGSRHGWKCGMAMKSTAGRKGTRQQNQGLPLQLTFQAQSHCWGDHQHTKHLSHDG